MSGWLEVSRLGADDALLVFSVGGGDAERNISPNLVRALDLARAVGASVYGIVGRDGGHTAAVGDVVVVIPPLFPDRITPHTEGLCAVVWHLLVSHPDLQRSTTKWEGDRCDRLALPQGARSSVAPGSSAATSSVVLLARDDVEDVARLRQLLVGPTLAPRPGRRRPAPRASSRARSRTSLG